LEYLRTELRAERISYGEIVELQSLVEYIDANDVELLEAAGVPEHDDEKQYKPQSAYKSQAAREAQLLGYGDKSYWDYLDEAALEHYAKGLADAYMQSLGDALRGNEGI
jgi:hypothetical protein